MSLNLEDKKNLVAEISQKLVATQTVALAEYRGITVSHFTHLRALARKSGVYLRVLKNTLVRRAVVGTPFEDLKSHMSGPLVYSFSEDPISAAKVLAEFSKTNDKLVLIAGSFAGKVLDRKSLEALAAIPSRDELLARLVAAMQAPLSGFVRCMAELATKKGSEQEAVSLTS